MSDQQALIDQATAALTRLRAMDQPAALAYLKQMDPTVFEYLTALLFEERGYPAAASGKPGDEGVDVLLRDGEYVGVVQCKRYDGSVGQPTIRDLYGTMMHNGAEEAYLVTTGTVTRQARDWAFGKPISLIDGHALAAWVTQTEADRTGGLAAGDLLRRRWVLWPLVIAGLILFGWGVFYAVSQLSDRFDEEPIAQSQVAEQPSESESGSTSQNDSNQNNSDQNEPDSGDVGQDESASVPATPILTSTSTAVPTNAATTAPTQTNTPLPTHTPAPQPTATTTVAAPTVSNAVAVPSPTPQTVDAPTVQSCSFVVDAAMRQWYSEDGLGCATGDMQIVWAAWQPFERGAMLWRSDTDAAYAFVAEPQQQWFEIRERWDGSSTAPREEEPPSGLQAPVRGFGYAWGVNDALFNILGWATENEKGFCLAVQPFEEGTILQSNRAQSCATNSEGDDLLNQARGGDWRPFTFVSYRNGAWE